MKHDHHHIVRNLMALMILCVGFGILLVFQTNSENIIEGNNFKPFMVLSIIGAGLLIGLLYLVNNSPHPSQSKSVRSPARKSKKRKK